MADSSPKGVVGFEAIVFALIVWIFLLAQFDFLDNSQQKVFGFLGDYVFELRYGPWTALVATSTCIIVGFTTRRRFGRRLAAADLHELVETWAGHQLRYPELHDWKLDYQELAVRLRAQEIVEAEHPTWKLKNRLLEGAHIALSPIAWISGLWTYGWLAVHEARITGASVFWALMLLPFFGLWLHVLLVYLGGYEEIQDRGAMRTLPVARHHHRNREFQRSLSNGFLPVVPNKIKFSEASVSSLRQMSFSGANSFDAFISQAQASLGLGPAQLFVVAYNEQLTQDLESPAQVNELWSRVVNQLLEDPRSID